MESLADNYLDKSDVKDIHSNNAAIPIRNSVSSNNSALCTVCYIGNIHETISNDKMLELLRCCGHIVDWKREESDHGTFLTFGFCKFKTPESTLRCIRLLNGLKVYDKCLIVKSDSKSQDVLKECRNDIVNEEDGEIIEDNLDDSIKTADLIVKRKMEVILESFKQNNNNEQAKLKEIPYRQRKEYSDDNYKKRERSPMERQSYYDRRKSSANGYKHSYDYDHSHSHSHGRERHYKDRDRDRYRSTDRNSSSSKHSSHDKYESRSRESRNRSKSPERSRRYSSDREKIEIELQRKEVTYQGRLNAWEKRETFKLQQYQMEYELEFKRNEEAKRMLKFLENYNDNVDDEKYYKGSAFSQLLEKRRIEKECDENDRIFEMNELKENNLTNISLIEENTEPILEEIRNAAINIQEEIDVNDSNDIQNTEVTMETCEIIPEETIENITETENLTTPVPDSNTNIQPETPQPPSQISPAPCSSTIADSIEEKRNRIKQLIFSIPKEQDDLFQFPIDWETVDSNLIIKRMKPWIRKKMIDFLGEEENTLTDFLCQKLLCKSSPKRLLFETKTVLDEEADDFVTKMWRLLIYETEAKRLGLSSCK